MSILAPDPPSPEGIRLSALANYAGEPGQLIGVGFWPRALARIIDFAVHYAITFCAAVFFTVMLVVAAGGRPSPLVMARLQHTTVTNFIVALLGSLLYHIICEGVHGSTLGKLVLSMTVVQEDGKPCRLWPAFIRSAGYLIDSLFFGLIGYTAMERSPQEQRYGDEWAHTVVCKRDDVPLESRRTVGRFFAAFLLAVMADSALAMLGLAMKI